MPILPLPWLAALGLLLVSLTAILTLRLQRGIARWRGRRRVRRGLRAERKAAALVEAAGYRLQAIQPEARYELRVDGRPQPVTVRGDLLARRRGRLFVVEVKTGRGVDPAITGTRRQLLEYRHAFEVDGLLLADPEAGELRAVEFPRRRPGLGAGWLIAAFAAGGLAGAAASSLLAALL
jgi:hypothetical protein